jgi:hypothetical protein
LAGCMMKEGEEEEEEEVAVSLDGLEWHCRCRG